MIPSPVPVPIGPGAKQFVIGLINETVRNTPWNRLESFGGVPIFDAPLVGFARADDAIFQRYKTVVAPFHMTPAEAFAAGTGEAVDPSRLAVVSWVLPISSRTRAANRGNIRYPARRWAFTRATGDNVHVAVRQRLKEVLEVAGYRVVEPTTLPAFKTEDIEGGPASAWSERHIAHACGLGTFGLSDGLITAKGMAHRLGSIVTDLQLEPAPRLYETHTAYCLHLSGYECGKCIDRCPAGAISEKGHSRLACRAYTYGTLVPYSERIGAKPTGCGLCQTGVPCEYRIPPRPQ